MALRRTFRRTQHLLAVLAGLTALSVPGLGLAAPAGTAHLAGLDRPSAIAAADGRLFVANAGDDSVLVLDATGKRLQRLAGTRYGFGHPDAIAAAGHHVFVLSRAGSLTELNATNGSVVRVIRGHRYGMTAPTALVVDAGVVWVADSGGNALTEISAHDGSLVRVVHSSSGRGQLSDPVAMTVAGSTLWVASHAGWVSQVRLADGHVVRRVTAMADGFSAPSGIADDGANLWVSNSASDTVTELTETGRLVQVITNSSHNANYGFDHPTQVLAHGGFVYVLSPASSSPMVTKVNKTSAEGLWFECDTNSPDPQFANPSSMTILGSHIWVVSPGPAIAGNGALANSLAELHLGSGQQIATYS